MPDPYGWSNRKKRNGQRSEGRIALDASASTITPNFQYFMLLWSAREGLWLIAGR